jgi:uncharacterized protein (DUF433 family)
MIDWEDHISIDPDIMTGKPVIKGTRITVNHIVELLKSRWSVDQIGAEYPGITREHIAACVGYAQEINEAMEALRDAEESGTISFDEIKKDLGL